MSSYKVEYHTKGKRTYLKDGSSDIRNTLQKGKNAKDAKTKFLKTHKNFTVDSVIFFSHL